jgi:hypothetical protein
MLADLELAEMRAHSTRALPDMVTISRPLGATLAENYVLVPTGPTTVYVGAGRVRPPNARETSVIFGDTTATATRYVLTVPYDTAAIELGDVVTVDVGSDPEIDSMWFRVVRNAVGSWLIDRRVGLETIDE